MTKPQEIVVEQEPDAGAGRDAASLPAVQQGGAVVAQSEAASFIQMVERASRDPAVDIDKMERLWQMRKEIVALEAERAYNAALSALQLELPEMPRNGAIKNKSGGIQSRYPLWEDMNKVLKPILYRHGFALNFGTGNNGAKIVVSGTLRHIQGHKETSSFEMSRDTSGSKNEQQGDASSISYGKRHIANALLNITSRGDDNDGGGGARKTAMDADVKQDFMDSIGRAANRKEAESLWTTIAAECTKIGDVESYAELHTLVGRKIKSFAPVKPAPSREDGDVI